MMATSATDNRVRRPVPSKASRPTTARTRSPRSPQ
jgi:hypothetical protein